MAVIAATINKFIILKVLKRVTFESSMVAKKPFLNDSARLACAVLSKEFWVSFAIHLGSAEQGIYIGKGNNDFAKSIVI